MKGFVQFHQEVKPIPLGGGTERRILAYDDSLMAVEVSFETGSEGAPHTHPHTQLSYVLSGGLVHGTVCLEKGVLLDVFTPKREDFLKV